MKLSIVTNFIKPLFKMNKTFYIILGLVVLILIVSGLGSKKEGLITISGKKMGEIEHDIDVKEDQIINTFNSEIMALPGGTGLTAYTLSEKNEKKKYFRNAIKDTKRIYINYITALYNKKNLTDVTPYNEKLKKNGTLITILLEKKSIESYQAPHPNGQTGQTVPAERIILVPLAKKAEIIKYIEEWSNLIVELTVLMIEGKSDSDIVEEDDEDEEEEKTTTTDAEDAKKRADEMCKLRGPDSRWCTGGKIEKDKIETDFDPDDTSRVYHKKYYDDEDYEDYEEDNNWRRLDSHDRDRRRRDKHRRDRDNNHSGAVADAGSGDELESLLKEHDRIYKNTNHFLYGDINDYEERKERERKNKEREERERREREIRRAKRKEQKIKNYERQYEDDYDDDKTYYKIDNNNSNDSWANKGSSNTSTNTSTNTSSNTSNKNVPPGDEDLYMLKTQMVTPSCPTCPSLSSSAAAVNGQNAGGNNANGNNANGNNNIIPPCPPCSRCPEPSFDCKKVPNYNIGQQNTYLPRPVLASFSQFGM